MRDAAGSVRNRSLELREVLEDEITQGVLKPGMRLDEVSLAERFGVSRTPIREALLQLASSGLIEIRPRRGAVVPHLHPQMLLEMFEVMAGLEALCARLAARRITVPQRQALIEAHAACGEPQILADPDEFFHRNEKFHQAIYQGSHNRYLIDQAENLQRRLSPYRRRQLHLAYRVDSAHREHREVMEAILAGDGETAARVLQAHVNVQGENFADLLAALQEHESRPAR